MNILPQIAQITQRNAASCIIPQRKTVCSYCSFGFRLRLSAGSAGDILGFLCTIDWVLLRDYSPADSADYAEECSRAVLFRRERLFGISVVLGFVCDYQRDLREIYWDSLCNNLSSLM